jgi:alpha-L-rhamnosidase
MRVTLPVRIGIVFFLVSGGVCADLQPERLRTEYLADPVGLDETRPRLSWWVTSEQRDQHQSARQILVASSREKLAADVGDLWDSGRVESAETVNIEYAGQPLTSRQTCFWKVRVWDREGRSSAWSKPAFWSVGLLAPDDWKAEWIAHRDEQPLHRSREALFLPPARYYRKTFPNERPVKRATLYASALGLAEFHLNGQRVGDAWFEPGWADYHRRVHYRTHDVTALVRTGENCLGAVVAEGWYAGYVGYGLLVGYGPNKAGRYFYGKTPALLAQLELEYADGSRETIATDPTWQVSADGPIREADLIMGEAFDARQDDANWCRPASAPAAARGPDRPWRWEHAIRAGDNGSTRAVFSDNCGEREVELGFRAPPRLQAYAAPPVRVTQELPARQLTEPAPGEYVFDFGQNFAGNVRLRVTGAAGTQVKLRFGEMLHPDGRLMTENLRRARATDCYTLRGDPGGETWTPRFTYHGFRFVELTGLPTRPPLDTVTGLVLHNDTPLTSEFACSDEVLTRFWQNTVWTQRANFVEIPTDCPQRDERLGWMGDAQIYIRTATFNADVAAFFTKWLDDVAEAQRDFGAYPDYCPYPMGHGAPGQTWGTAWTDAGIICPHTIWQVYGDTRVIQRHWHAMTRFMDWRKQRAPDLRGKADGNTWGDWLNLNEPTPLELIDAAYFTHDAALMADMARAIGRDAEAAAYADLRERLAAQFARDYLPADGAPAEATQTAHVLALCLVGAPAEKRTALAASLAARIARNDFRMATGFLGTKHLLPALSEGGYDDLAARLFQSRRFPSWGYEVINGATTVWERWDSFTTEHGFNGAAGDQNAAMNSFSHYAFGGVMEWAFRQLAGIDTDGPGYRKLVIAPRPPAPDAAREVPPVSWVRARYDSIRGPIASAWQRTGSEFELEVTLPANTTATVFLPASSVGAVREGGRALGEAPGVRLLREEPGRLVLAVGSGHYRFTAGL